MKKYTTAAALLGALVFWNCSDDTQSGSNATVSEGNFAKVSLSLQYDNTPLLDSLVLDCFGADTLHYVHSSDDGYFNLDLFPGDNWKFNAKIYANGNLMQVGEQTANLAAGDAANVSIQMRPIVGFVYVEIPLGLKNDAGIAKGLMTLKSKDKSYSIPMEITAESGIFKSEMLKLGTKYDIAISLYNKEDVEIYSLADSLTLTEDSPVPSLTLKSLRSQVGISVQMAEDRNVSITLPLKSSFHKPKAEDLLITEYFAAPDSKDSTQFEFVEIFNGTLDTLLLDDCSLGITGASRKDFPLTVSEVAPGQVLILGDAISSRTPANYINTYGWLALGNSKGGLTLTCDGIVIDSLYYAAEADSLHPQVVPSAKSKYGISGQLNIEQWKNRSDSTAWCLGKPTPGEVKFCN